MTATIEAKKQKIAESKKRLEFQERQLREKEKKVHTRKLIRMGALIEKSQIDFLTEESLLGALLEIKDLSKNEKKVNEWESIGSSFKDKETEENGTPLSVSFEKETSKEAIAILKQHKFQWNRFRKEWYGYGTRDEMEKLLETFNPTIEIIEA